MLKVRCVASPEIEDKVITVLQKYNIKIDPDSKTVLLQEGLQAPDSDILISFKPDRFNILEDFIDKLSRINYSGPDIIIGSRHNSWETIQTADILFFRAEGNYVYAVTEDNEFEVKHKLYELENRFAGSFFIRTGKSSIVNILKVKEIIPHFRSRLLLRIEGTDKRLEVSRNYLGSFKRYLEL